MEPTMPNEIIQFSLQECFAAPLPDLYRCVMFRPRSRPGI